MTWIASNDDLMYHVCRCVIWNPSKTSTPLDLPHWVEGSELDLDKLRNCIKKIPHQGNRKWREFHLKYPERPSGGDKCSQHRFDLSEWNFPVVQRLGNKDHNYTLLQHLLRFPDLKSFHQLAIC